MPADVLRPLALVGAAQFVPTNPLNDNVANLADGSDATYNGSSTAGQKDAFTCPYLPVDRWKVTSVDLVWRALNAGLGTARAWWKLGATTVNGTTRTLTAAQADYTEAAIARPGGGTWKPVDFETLEWGYEVIAPTGGETRVADLKLVATTTFYDEANPSIRTIDAVKEPVREPVRCQIEFTLQDPEDISWVDGATDRVLVVGPVTVPGALYKTYLSLSRSTVVNPRAS